MLAYVQAFFNIAILRSGPEDLPDSPFLLGLTLAVYLGIGIPLTLINFGPSVMLARVVVADLATLFIGMWVLLSLAGFRSRYMRTVTAMLGTDALLSALSIPFSLLRQSVPDAEPGMAMPIVVAFAMSFWVVAINGHIFSRALSRPFVIGLLIAIAYFFLHMTVLFELAPSGNGAPSGQAG